MGIRVNKMVGYGLVDVATDADGRIVDPRINPKSPLLDYGQDVGLDAYLDFLDGLGDDDGRYEAATIRSLGERSPCRGFDPQSAVVHASEGGLVNVLCLRPVWMDQWHRSDDPIDWIEESYLVAPEQRQAPRVDVLPHGIYPYNGIYVDTRDGARLGDEVMWWIRARSRTADADTGLAMREFDALAQIIRRRGDRDGDPVFGSHTEAEQFIAPVVPEEVRALVRFGGLFTDETVLLQLRPMRYVWWC